MFLLDFIYTIRLTIFIIVYYYNPFNNENIKF